VPNRRIRVLQDRILLVEGSEDAKFLSALLPPPKNIQMYALNGRPAVGVFIAPDGLSPGSLESLCVRSVSEELEARCANDYLKCVKRVRNTEWNAAKRDKAFTYAYLATGPDPENALGVGAAQGIWNRDSPVFRPLRAFVERLGTVGGTNEPPRL